MVRIQGIPDVSKFVRQVNKVKMYNTIQLVIGVQSIEVNGYIISRKSELLERLVSQNCELYLDQFVGEEEGVQDLVELLYGADIVLSQENVNTLLKFSVLYKVQDVYELCMTWVKDNLLDDTLFHLIEVGLMVESFAPDNHEVLDLCMKFITETLQDGLATLSQSWPLSNNFVRFLVQRDVLYYTLPVLTAWISGDSDVRLILEQVEQKGLQDELFRHGARSTQLFDKMSDKMELLETSRALLKLQSTQVNTPTEAAQPDAVDKDNKVSSPKPSQKNLSDLLALPYQTFAVDQIIKCEKEYGLNHFQYADVVLGRILGKHKILSQRDVLKLWNSFRQIELEWYFTGNLGLTIEHSRSRENITYKIPEQEFDEPGPHSQQTEHLKHIYEEGG